MCTHGSKVVYHWNCEDCVPVALAGGQALAYIYIDSRTALQAQDNTAGLSHLSSHKLGCPTDQVSCSGRIERTKTH